MHWKNMEGEISFIVECHLFLLSNSRMQKKLDMTAMTLFPVLLSPKPGANSSFSLTEAP